jgi:hypothetical protein
MRWNGPPAAAVHSRPAVPPRYRFQYAGSRPQQPFSSVWAVSSMATPATGPNGSRRDGPPSGGTACAQNCRSNGWPLAVSAMISPSGVQPDTVAACSPQ